MGKEKDNESRSSFADALVHEFRQFLNGLDNAVLAGSSIDIYPGQVFSVRAVSADELTAEDVEDQE